MDFLKYLFQFAILCSVSLAGELLHAFLPLPVPGSVYGMLLLLLLLCSGILKLKHVEEAGNYLIAILPILFTPTVVGLSRYFDLLSGYLLPVLFICVGIALVTILVTGHTAQALQSRKRKTREGAGLDE